MEAGLTIEFARLSKWKLYREFWRTLLPLLCVHLGHASGLTAGFAGVRRAHDGRDYAIGGA